jgi:polysaccharide export outer membrane protein
MLSKPFLWFFPIVLSRNYKLTAVVAGLTAWSLVASSCTFLPSSGPSGFRVRLDASDLTSVQPYELLPVDHATLDALRNYSPAPPYLAVDQGGRSKSEQRGIEELGQGSAQVIQPGDIVHVAIFETGGGLFSPLAAEGQSGGSPVTSLPAQRIDQIGDITVPYAGRVRAVGRLPRDLESDVKDLLKQKTVDPQVIVTVGEREGGDLVSVGGDVKNSTQVAVALAGTRVVDAVTAAGGSLVRPHLSMVSVSRSGATRYDTLQQIYDNPRKNILLQPGDTVLVRARPINFMVFGAGGQIGKFPIESEDLTLAEAMAQSGGPSDTRANPSAIFIYRREKRGLLESLGKSEIPEGASVPVIYRLELQKPNGFFFASNFAMRDRDIIYYGSASSVGVLKFMSLINSFFAPARSGLSTASGVETF